MGAKANLWYLPLSMQRIDQVKATTKWHDSIMACYWSTWIVSALFSCLSVFGRNDSSVNSSSSFSFASSFSFSLMACSSYSKLCDIAQQPFDVSHWEKYCLASKINLLIIWRMYIPFLCTLSLSSFSLLFDASISTQLHINTNFLCT